MHVVGAGLKRGVWLAHRLSWTLNRGVIPDGLWVLHRCDNRKCVRPDHLFLGSAADNNADMYAKGRNNNRRGESVRNSVLTEEKVRAIRTLDRAGFTTLEIGRIFDLDHAHAWRVANAELWRHV